MSDFEIRPIKSEELPEILEKVAAISPWNLLGIDANRLLVGIQTDPLRETLVCLAADGEAAGCVGYRKSRAPEYLINLGAGALLCRQTGLPEQTPADEFPDAGYVNLLAVFPDYQNKGIGNLLLRHVEKILHDAGQGRLYLCVSGFNVGARQFYEREGFRYIGDINDCIRPGNTEHVMFKAVA